MSVRDLIILGCSSQQPTRKRNHGAYLLRWNDEGFLFDPGEGTQRQFIFANVAPTCVTRIFVSHFHGDHCLGLGSMLMRLNLDKVTHLIHCYYPASGQVYFDRLRYGTMYHENIQVICHPVHKTGLVEEDEKFRIEAFALDHGVENFAWRIKEKDSLKFDKQKLKEKGVHGEMVRMLERDKKITVNGQVITLDEVSHIRHGDVFSIVIDTLPCPGAIDAAKNATLLLCESTYLDEHAHLAKEYSHMTAKQAAEIANKAGAKELILTHFSARYQDLDAFEKEARVIFPRTFAADDLKVFPFPKTP
ncbi:MAG: ribonuclease Z [Verrucomicrobia bacterium]|nr:ribonuclease Z [Verrucomicrobiota bacterium]